MSVNFKEEIKKILVNAGVKETINFSVPPKAEMGDLAFACFELSKKTGQNPAETAQELKQRLQKDLVRFPFLEKVDAVGPYVNFYLRVGFLADQLIKDIAKKNKKYAWKKTNPKTKVLLEYPSNNTHKEVHIGHLRNICIGNALFGIYQALGYKVVPINYVNDFGAHVAKCLWWIKKQGNLASAKKTNKQKWLGEQYALASQYIEAHPEVKEEVAHTQRLLERKSTLIWPLFLVTRKWSLAGFKKIFKELGVKHHHSFFEKDIKAQGQKVVNYILKNGLAKKGEGGAIIMDLSAHGLDIALLRKSDGAGVYLTSDLALAKEKNKKYKPTENVYITGQEQDFYFQQLFKILEILGDKHPKTHIGYGLVSLSGGKMSSRAGNVVLYEDLLTLVKEAVLQKAPNLKKDKKRWEKIALASVKFDFLKHESGKNIIFNPAEACSFDGFTGPYILYAIARVNGLHKKNGLKKAGLKNLQVLVQPEEKKLLLLMSDYEEKLAVAFQAKNPSVLARYAFDLAQQFNNFYNKLPILNADSQELKEARLSLSYATSEVLTNVLRVLGIEAVKEM